jgi:hypothetical protein
LIELDAQVIVAEMENTYSTKDGRKIVLPCSNLFRFNSKGQLQEMKIYMDAGPLFAPPASA